MHPNQNNSGPPPPYGGGYPPAGYPPQQYYPPMDDYYRQQPRDDYYAQPPREDYYAPQQYYAPPPPAANYYPQQAAGGPPMYYAPPPPQGRGPPQMYPPTAPAGYPPAPYPPVPPQQQRQRGSRSRSPKRGLPSHYLQQQQMQPPQPPMKPGDIAFSILIPNFGDLQHQAHMFQHDVANEFGIRITMSAPDLRDSTGTPRRVVKFIGKWPPCLAAQRRVLDFCQKHLEGGGRGGNSAQHHEIVTPLLDEVIVLLPRDKEAMLTSAKLEEIRAQTQTQISTYTSQGGQDARYLLVSISTPPAMRDDTVVVRTNRISNAQRLIKQACDTAAFLSDEPSSASAEASSAEQTKMIIPVPSRFAGSVIGKNAQIVRDMEHTTKARINLSREGTRVVNLATGETFRFVTAEGTAEQVVHASKLVAGYLKEAKERFAQEGVQQQQPKDRTYKVPLSVPDHLIGVIIGKGGKALKTLQEDYQCKVVIEHNEDAHQKSGKMNRLVEIIGDTNRVEVCEKYIVEKLIDAAAAAPPPASAPERRPRSRDRRRAASPPPRDDLPQGEGQDRMIVSVPIAQVGAVIGNRGATVRQICEESGGRVHIESKDEVAADAVERKVTITGHPHQIHKALGLIQRALFESNEARKGNNGSQQSSYNSSSSRGEDLVKIVSSTLPPQQPLQMMAASSHHHLPPLPPQNFYPTPLPPAYASAPVATGGSDLRLFDPDKLSILASQLTKNFPPVGSGNITQITGSPNNAGPPPPQNQQQHPRY